MNTNNQNKKDKEIESAVTLNIVLAGRHSGNSIAYIYKAEAHAKQHSKYKQKYENSLKLLKSMYRVSDLTFNK